MIISKPLKIFTCNLVCIICTCICLSSCSKKYSSTDENDYAVYLAEVLDAELYMPKLNDIGQYTAILMTRKTPGDAFFSTTDSVALVAKYDKEAYTIEKNNAISKYSFFAEGRDYVEDVEASVKNFDFMVVDNIDFYGVSNYGEYVLFPNNLLIVGFDDLNCKIAYLYYWDHALDYIENLDEFIEKKFVLD